MILPLLSPAAIHDTYLSTKSTCSTEKRKKTCVHQHHQSQDDKFATNEVPAIFPCQIVYLCRRRALFGFSQGNKKTKSNGWSDGDQRSKNTKRNGNYLSTLRCTCLKLFNGAMQKRSLQHYWMRCIHDGAPSCISIERHSRFFFQMAVLTFAFFEKKKNAHFFFWLFSRPKTKSNGWSDGDQRSKNNPKTQNEFDKLRTCFSFSK